MTDINTIMTQHFMLVTCASSRPPQSKKLRKVGEDIARQNGANGNTISATKELWVDCPEMEAVGTAINAALTLHRKYTAPFSMDGVRLIKNITLMEKYIPEMGTAIENIEKQADNLLSVYDQRVREQLTKLGGFGEITDYPSADEINNWDWFGYRMLPVPAARDWDRVEGVSIGQYLADQTADMVTEAAKLAVQDACKRVVKPVQAMAYATDPQAGGKRARPVHESLVENIRQAVENLTTFNIFADPVVSEMINQLAQLARYTPEQIKLSESAKVALHEEADNLLARMADLGWGEGE